MNYSSDSQGSEPYEEGEVIGERGSNSGTMSVRMNARLCKVMVGEGSVEKDREDDGNETSEGMTCCAPSPSSPSGDAGNG